MTKRPHARRSPIWTMPLDQFKQIVASSTSLSDILRACGIRPVGHNSLTLKKRLKEEGIDYSHIMLGRSAAFKRGVIGYRPQSKTLEQCMETVFIAHSEGSKNSVRKYLRRYKLIEERCRDCPLTDTWQHKPLTLQLEHISGDSFDDRLENLCWLCPNCHSQTDTYTGKANRKPRVTKVFALAASPISSVPQSKISRRGQGQLKGPRPECHKVPHPTREVLQEQVWLKPLRQLAEHYGVQSGGTVKEWAIQMNILMPPHGYWQRRHAGYSHQDALAPRTKSTKTLPKFTANQIIEIRVKLASGARPAHLAREYRCGHKTMRDIRDRVTYRWVA